MRALDARACVLHHRAARQHHRGRVRAARERALQRRGPSVWVRHRHLPHRAHVRAAARELDGLGREKSILYLGACPMVEYTRHIVALQELFGVECQSMHELGRLRGRAARALKRDYWE
jgi:hypothetical protein